jgi:hypothetical protein
VLVFFTVKMKVVPVVSFKYWTFGVTEAVAATAACATGANATSTTPQAATKAQQRNHRRRRRNPAIAPAPFPLPQSAPTTLQGETHHPQRRRSVAHEFFLESFRAAPPDGERSVERADRGYIRDDIPHRIY